MVKLMRSGNIRPERETTARRDNPPVKLEIVEDSLEEEYGPLNKRYRPSSNLQQWNSDANAFPATSSQYNTLDEPSPLGLRLRKSPSLLDLIQIRLSQSQSSASAENLSSEVNKEAKAAGTTDKLKASNFPASILRIGNWEYKSRYGGDLVAKCYFAKHKLVWEVLEGGLKSKIEIQWSDIMALKADCPDNGPGTLNVVLARQPLFFRETNPQPRKHTLWQATSDFTDGQASIHRQHFLQCPQGSLNKHFEKLIQCDIRLNCLSKQPEIDLGSPYFESGSKVFEEPDELKGLDFGPGETGKGSTSSGFWSIASPATGQSSSLEVEKGDSAGLTSENMSREAPSPSSANIGQSVKNKWNSDANAFPATSSQYNTLDEPSPLGLRLRKSPSLLDLIQIRLSQSQSSASAENLSSEVNKEAKAAGTTDKLKASNFPASILRIGNWEYKSRYGGDLVAKCYFAKHKLVWEVLEGGLKSKIEIQWSDIMALKADCPDNGPGTLNVVLARQPLFFRETNPQPRKHTLWQATSDFTDGQASIHRQHFLQCPQGSLNKHFEKLIQCDIRLNCLSKQPEIDLGSPYFESGSKVFEEPDELKGLDFGPGETGKGSTSSGFWSIASPATGQSSSLEVEKGDSAGLTSENMSREAPSPSSVMDSHADEGSGVCEAVDSKGPKNWDQKKLHGLDPSMSMSDLMSHIGHRLSEQMTSGNPSSESRPDCQEMLEEITQYLLSDTQLTIASDEKSLMSRVNSLCCLLQKDTTTGTSSQATGENYDGLDDDKDVQLNKTHESGFNITVKSDVKAFEGDTKEVSGSKQAPGMSRKDSFGELLLHLPRIASLPKFLFNISEENGESQAR
ncbi:hypothetical protein PTKIN_Ptkin03bG0145000 [Pterospermum kingtungense]